MINDRLQDLKRADISKYIFYATLFIFIVFLSYIHFQTNLYNNLIISTIIFTLPLVFLSLYDIKIGFIIVLLTATAKDTIARLLGYDLPVGAISDFFTFVTFIGIFIKQESYKIYNWKDFGNPITVMVLLWVLFNVLQVFNPSAVNIDGWVYALRGLSLFLIVYVIAFRAFSEQQYIKFFTYAWVSIAVLAGAYAIFQELNGLADWELKWVYSSPARVKLVYIWGRFRKFSFLSDPASFGIFMAFSGIFCTIISIGQNSLKKSLLLIGGVICFIGMAYSGTRTAYVMVPAGFSLFALLSLHNYKALIYTVILFLIGILILFGPFKGNTINRLRSTLEIAEDPSMTVRDNNRQYIQPYIWNHPIGAGLFTTGVMGLRYSPDHPLAGFPPDSGYLRQAIETGYIGLFIAILLRLIVLIVGISYYYRTKNKRVKIYYAAYLCAFFGLIIADMAQVAFGPKPLSYIYLALYALMIKLKDN